MPIYHIGVYLFNDILNTAALTHCYMNIKTNYITIQVIHIIYNI